ncbi:hypothetical protein EDC96DRAFT_604465 [Choanephora cucurbitarum]|nr:hypothetical protein EDC96DRAFT_604465 [Choanephora cucurbitarum]
MTNNQLPADLEEFVSKEVSSLCDADPAVLAQYIVALIGNEERNDALKAKLETQLSEFFDSQTMPFIDRLFAKINGNEISQDNGNASGRNNDSRFRGDYSDEEDDGDRNFKHRRQRSNSRDEHQERDYSYKRRYDDDHHNSGNQSKYQRSSNPNSIPVSGGYNTPSYDSRSRSNTSSRGMRGGSNNAGRNQRGQSRPQCRDYNEKGFCMRGDLCPYDHGMDRIIVDESGVNPFPGAGTFPPNPMGRTQPPFFGMPGVSDTYDPERSGLLPGNDVSFIPPNDMMKMRPGTMYRGRGGGMGAGVAGRGRGGYQRHLHQNRNPQNTTLVVEKIPPECCQIAIVNDYFAKFGTITNISVQPNFQKAIIQYSTRAEAEKAYSSPDVIFDNRFVKVYWSKEDTNGTEMPSSATALPVAQQANHPSAKVSNEPDPELIAKRAAELAALREEKQKKHQEHMKSILELQKKRELQLQQQIDEQKRLLARLTDSANMSVAEKAELLRQLKQVQSDIDTSRNDAAAAASAAANAQQQQNETAGQDETTATTIEGETKEEGQSETTEDLKKKLARLEAEAAQLGIYSAGAFRGGRGGYYGRGRGSWPRMRGGMTRMTLDNRPTKISITSIPEETTEAELRPHFEQFGQVTLFEKHEHEAIVQYSQRYEAEKAMSFGTNYPKGTLQLAWATNNNTGPTSETEQTA